MNRVQLRQDDLAGHSASSDCRHRGDELGPSVAHIVAARDRLTPASAVNRHPTARFVHDGAQQRLVNLLLRPQSAGEDPGSTGQLTTPGVLPAVQALAARTVVPTAVKAHLSYDAAPETREAVSFLAADARADGAEFPMRVDPPRGPDSPRRHHRAHQAC